ncbi:inositol 2-dehydrogenase [Paenibacillus azoreducens]|uniref:inositol 2-dehydrogenase n=1 Tax=Paenibacillus azoreducens TaxID=116718 RepID=UPI0039F571C6
MRKIKCGVIGAGRVGMMHIQNLVQMSEVEIVAVADLFIDNVQAELSDMGITNIHKDYHELLANDTIEAVFVFTSTDTHEEIVIASAQAGKHIFCEKPLSMDHNEETSIKVLQEVKKRGVKLQIGFNRRIDAQFRNIYEQVRAGSIGEPQIVKITSRDPDLLPYELIKRIGGLLFDFTMHDFDMARYMVGSNITEVYAKGGTLIDPGLKSIGDVDTLAIVVHFENGAVGLIDNSRRAVYGYDQRVEVFGSEGMLKAENVNQSTVEHYGNAAVSLKKPLPVFNDRYRDAYMEETRFFVQALLNNTPLLATGEDVIMAQRVAIAAQLSLEIGQPVKVDPVIPQI